MLVHFQSHHKGHQVHLGLAPEDSFMKLKELITSTPVLVLLTMISHFDLIPMALASLLGQFSPNSLANIIPGTLSIRYAMTPWSLYLPLLF
jgi:hypothetical protein